MPWSFGLVSCSFETNEGMELEYGAEYGADVRLRMGVERIDLEHIATWLDPTSRTCYLQASLGIPTVRLLSAVSRRQYL